jgi:hypothetical protein
MSRVQNAGQNQTIKMVIKLLEVWQSSNIWGQSWQIKFEFMKKLKHTELHGAEYFSFQFATLKYKELNIQYY